jgi:hypothetical protein
MFRWQLTGQDITRFPFCQGNQYSLMILADYRIAFLIFNTSFLLDDLGSFINADSVANSVTSFLPTCIALESRFLAA